MLHNIGVWLKNVYSESNLRACRDSVKQVSDLFCIFASRSPGVLRATSSSLGLSYKQILRSTECGWMHVLLQLLLNIPTIL